MAVALVRGKPEAASGLSPERQALGIAIRRLTEHNTRIAEVNAALQTAQESVYAARRHHEAADAAIETAKAAASAHLIDVAAGRTGVPPITVRQARDGLQDAMDGLEAARQAVATLNAQRDELAGSTDLLADHVHTAAAAVIATSPEVAALAARVEHLQRELADAGNALDWLWARRAVAIGEVGRFGMRESTVAERAKQRLDSVPRQWLFGDDPPVAGSRPWELLLTALMIDATTPLTL